MRWIHVEFLNYSKTGIIISTSNFQWSQPIDILLLGCYNKFSCFLIKLYSHLAKLAIPQIHPLYPIPSPLTGWTNWPINDKVKSNLNLRQFFPCLYYWPIIGHLCCMTSFFKGTINSFQGHSWKVIRCRYGSPRFCIASIRLPFLHALVGYFYDIKTSNINIRPVKIQKD